MLTHLKIKNFGLIDELGLDFDSGLNVLTGETGAGKSMLIDALRLVLGERVEKDQIREPDKPCLVEAVFTIDDPSVQVPAELSGFFKAGDECLILRREITSEGRSKNTINQGFVNLSDLKSAGRWLVDLHGHYDQQRIFEPAWHAKAVDRLAGTGEALTLYQKDYDAYANLLRQRDDMLARAEHKEREIDLLSYQIREIEKAGPEEGEDDRLREERVRMAHSERIHLLTSQILAGLNEGEDCVSDRLASGFRAWAEWARLDTTVEPLRKEMEAVQANVESLIRAVSDYRESLSFAPDRLREIDERLDGLELIKRKYGGSLGAALGYLEESRKKLDLLTNSEIHRKEMDGTREKMRAGLEKKSLELSKQRRKVIAGLNKKVSQELADLGIRHARFECRMEKGELGRDGADRIEFYASLNAGEDLKPAAHIASSGEASRIILALKRALMAVESAPTLIFDEIDANIGGRLGSVVGQKMKEIAAERQVFLITHLPQIASFADRHIKVKKTAQGKSTRVDYILLQGQERIRELAQMMSGEAETEISKVHAREMLKSAEQVR